MSDLYLVLRNRLDGVPEWVFIETDVLRAARERVGLSYEAMAREIHVSSKTWERYEKAGRVPRPILPTVASVLNLEIEEPARTTVVVRPGESQLDRIEASLTAIDRKLDGDRQALEQRLMAIDGLLRDSLRARLEA